MHGTRRQTVRRLSASGAVLAVAMAAAYIAAANPVASDADPAVCQGTTATIEFGGGTFNGLASRLSSTGELDLPTRRTYQLATSIPAGTYDLDAVSYDGYEGRAGVLQFSEFWKVQLLAADGTVLATSETTDDVPDGVDEATVAGGIGQVSWTDEPAVALRTVHGAEGALHVNSVSPVCVGFTPGTDVDAGTEAPGGGTSGPDGSGPDGSGPDGSGPDGSGPDGSGPDVPTEVGGRVELPPTAPAQAADADPAFTG